MASGNGIMMVFTGPGKGKTTAALGAALRLLGHGARVCLVQFVKSSQGKSGEYEAAKVFGDRFEIHALGHGFVFKHEDNDKHCQAAQSAWQLAEEKISSGRYDLVILDEISYPMAFGFISPETVLVALKRRPGPVHVCLTGRNMPSAVTEAADLVTSMEEKAHPFHKGRKNIEGIDY